MWTLHSGATYALTHFFQGKEGASLDGYVRTANDILFNPEGIIKRVERAYEEQLEADGDDESLRQDCTQPVTLYTVPPAGRDELAVAHSRGIGHGDGVGDLGESTLHRVMVEYGGDPDSPVAEAVAYHGVEDGCLDAAGLDAAGEVVVALEAGHGTNDLARAVLEDFDCMAACDPGEAIWLINGRSTVTEVLTALHDPINGPVRVEKSYSESTPLSSMRIDAAGLSPITTFNSLYRSLDVDE